MNETLRSSIALIKLLILDVDGVLTDGRIYVDDKGEEHKAFHVQDGHGIKLLKKTGIQIAVISGRNSPSVAHRMQQLGIQHVYQGNVHKQPIYENLLKELDMTDSQVAYMGDDLPDIPLLRRVGLSVAVANAVKEVKEVSSIITQQMGGQGAVREICELIMHTQQTWEKATQVFMQI